MGVAKVTRNFQVTIPKDVRQVKNIRIGDTVFFTIEGEKVDFFKMSRENVLRDAVGIWKKSGKKTSVGYVRELRKEWEKRSERVSR